MIDLDILQRASDSQLGCHERNIVRGAGQQASVGNELHHCHRTKPQPMARPLRIVGGSNECGVARFVGRIRPADDRRPAAAGCEVWSIATRGRTWMSDISLWVAPYPDNVVDILFPESLIGVRDGVIGVGPS